METKDSDTNSVTLPLYSTPQENPKFEFEIDCEKLAVLCSFDERTNPKQLTILETYGGVEGVALLLKSSVMTGLTTQSVSGSEEQQAQNALTSLNDKNARQLFFGRNQVPPARPITIIEIVFETIKQDPIIKLLIIGAIVVLALGTAMCPSHGWIEGVAILVAVIFVLSVSAGNDYQKDKQFRKLLLLQTDKRVKVIRNSKTEQISSWDLLVGDLAEITVGDEIVADGIFVHGNMLLVDESPLTGETQPVKKNKQAPFLFSGTQVSEGNGVFLVTCVGIRSAGGQIQALLNQESKDETPLQKKLKVIASMIGKIGIASGILTFIGLAIQWGVSWARNNALHSAECGGTNGEATVLMRLRALSEAFVVAITIIVVAVPEGLPLAVTISLAFSMFKMIKDRCFVRHLDASETMGQATCICTDKTGTLTENCMTVTHIYIGQQEYYGLGSGDSKSSPFSPETLPRFLRDIFVEGVSVNSTCFIKSKDDAIPVFIGSPTEGALLVLSSKFGIEYDTIRDKVVKVENGLYLFSSERKRMSILVEPVIQIPNNESKYRLYSKGASEIMLGLCSFYLNDQGVICVLDSKEYDRIAAMIKTWAECGLRTIGTAFKNISQESELLDIAALEKELVFVGLVAIKDPLRKNVPEAVLQCQKAGLVVRMVTGDNILTASKIARECNILNDSGIALEGPAFRALSLEEKIQIIPRMQVLARSSPSDKHTLVTILKSLGEVVAVTGDGTNDAPAMKAADISFAMGVTGTQIAMNASDIVLLDDNFVSLVSSIRWGRNVLDSVRKFLQFQLGVNLTAITVTFVGSVAVGESPLSTVQLLWVNLIMDSFGALALASDEPDEDILDRPPHTRSESLLNDTTWEYIIIQWLYQSSVLIILFFVADLGLPINTEYHSTSDTWPSKRTHSLVFLTFILMQLANEITARQLNRELNVFKSFFRNKIFLFIFGLTAVIQIIVSTVGTVFVQATPLDYREWILCIILSLLNFPIVILQRIICTRVDMKKKIKAIGNFFFSVLRYVNRASELDLSRVRKQRNDVGMRTKHQEVVPPYQPLKVLVEDPI